MSTRMSQTPVRIVSLPPETLSRLAQEFDRFAQAEEGTQAAMLATIDGFEIASRLVAPGFRSQNLAAMASSLTAISRAITKEVSFDGCNRLLLESVSGKIIFQPVTTLGVPCTLCLAVSGKVTLGRTLWSLDEFVKHLRSLT